MVKTSHKASSDSRGGEIDPTLDRGSGRGLAAIFNLLLSYTDSCSRIYCAINMGLAVVMQSTHHSILYCWFLCLLVQRGPCLIHFRYTGGAISSGLIETTVLGVHSKCGHPLQKIFFIKKYS